MFFSNLLSKLYNKEWYLYINNIKLTNGVVIGVP